MRSSPLTPARLVPVLASVLATALAVFWLGGCGAGIVAIADGSSSSGSNPQPQLRIDSDSDRGPLVPPSEQLPKTTIAPDPRDFDFRTVVVENYVAPGSAEF